jgi:putative spermidine/putrescine transport system ATP-binding protein
MVASWREKVSQFPLSRCPRPYFTSVSRLDCIDLGKSYGPVRAVAGISLSVGPGEFFSLLGPSGSGKTTMLRLIAGLEDPDCGDIRIGSESVRDRPPSDRRLGMVFQHYALFPHLTVERNVAYGLERRGLPRPAIAERVHRALDLVKLAPAVFGARRPEELSGGERQRVALARALVLEPALLLLDEPLGALDLALRTAMQLELRQLNRALGITFVYVTHDQGEALTLSDRLAVMERGRLVQVGTPREIYERPRTAFVARFIGESNVLVQEGRPVSVRPERIELVPPGAAGGAPIGRVEDTLYQGERVRVTVALADGGRVIASLPNDGRRSPPPDPGTPVAARWRPEDAWPLEDS